VRLERKRNEELGFKVTTTPGFVPAKLKGDRRSRSDGAKQPDWLLAQAGLSFPGPGPGYGLGMGERVRALRRAGRGSGRGPLSEEQGWFRSLCRMNELKRIRFSFIFILEAQLMILVKC
jgi:hypothetical protein